MNSLADKISKHNLITSIFGRLAIFVIFIILVLVLAGFRSTQAQDQWRVFTTQNSQLPTNSVGSIVIDRNNVKWIGTAQGLVKIDGNNWTIYDSTNTPLGDNSISPKTIDKFNNLWVGVAYKGVAKYNGVNWVIYDTTNSGLPANSVTCVSIDSNNIKWIGTIWGIGKFDDIYWTIYRTTNSGLPANFISKITIENNVKWIGTFTLDGGMAKFNDSNWVVYNTTNSGIPNNVIHDIQIDNWGIKWIGTDFGGGVGRYNSVINSWIVYNTQNSGLPNGYVYSVLTQNHIKWFGTLGGGLARFNDTNWQVFNTYNSPLPSYSVLALALDSLGNLWIGTGGGLAVYNPTGIVGNITKPSEIPQDYQLFQNYPNPFNPITNIKYQIIKSSNVKLIIYGVQGKEIETLVNSYQRAGIYEVLFDGTNSPSGVYFYKLETENYSETKKMVLVK